MTYQLQLYFSTEWETVEAVMSDLVLTEVLHKNLAPADNSLRGKIKPSVALVNKLKGFARGEIRARIYKDGVLYFTGYLRKSFVLTKTGTLQPVAFEVVSPSNILKKKITANLFYQSYKVSDTLDKSKSIVHALAVHSGLSLADITVPDIPAVIPMVNIEENKTTYHAILTEILFCYGYVLDFDNAGRMILSDLFPASPTTTNLFNAGNCMGSIVQTKAEEENDVVTVSWTPVSIVPNTVIFSDTTGADSSHKCYVKISPNSYLGDGSSDEWYAKFGINEKTLVGATDATLSLEAEAGISLELFTPGNLSALVKIKNTNLTTDKYITKFDIVGTAFIKDNSVNVSKVSNADTDKVKDVKAAYIFAKTYGDALAQKLASYYKYADFTYSTKSKTDYPLGSFVSISDTGLGTSLVRVIERSTNLQTLTIEYKLESIAEYSPIDTEYIRTVPNPPPAPSPTYLEVTKFRFETRYKRSGTRPAAPTVADPTDWSVIAEEGSDALWMTGANINFDGTLIGTWYAPVRFTGASTVVGVLTNEQHAIPTDEMGDNGNYVGAESELRIFEGSVDTTALWVVGATPSDSITGTLAGSKYTVIGITNDAGFVDFVATRSGMSTITRRFSLTRSRLGDPVPAYRMGVSTSIVKIYPDGTISPTSVEFSAVASIGLTAQTAYAGIFKFFVNDILQMQSTAPQNYFEWSVFPDYPGTDDYPSLTDYPSFVFEQATEDVQAMRVELWSSDLAVKLDSQSIVFFKDVGFQLQDILDAAGENTPGFVPKYLGKYLDSLPAVYRFGDWFTIYGSDNMPYVRGVYLVNQNLTVTRIQGDSGADAPYMVAALSDILEVTSLGYGILTDYGSITYIANLAANSIFTQALQIGTGQVTGLGELAELALSDLGALATQDTVTAGQVTGLGALATDEMVELARLGSTIIQGGYLKTALLDVNTILGENAIFSGTMQAVKGLFSGSIESGPLQLNIGPPATNSLSTGGKLVSAFIAEVVASGIALGTYLCSGTYNGSIVDRITLFIGSPVVVSYETATSYDYTTTSHKTVPVGKDYNGNTIYWEVYYWTRVTSTWKRNRTEFENSITFKINGGDVVVSGAVSPSETWQLYSSVSNSGWTYHATPADTPAPTTWSAAYNTCPTLAAGTISYTANSFTMKFTNLPAYSDSLPPGTVYLKSDGAGNYDLKVKG